MAASKVYINPKVSSILKPKNTTITTQNQSTTEKTVQESPDRKNNSVQTSPESHLDFEKNHLDDEQEQSVKRKVEQALRGKLTEKYMKRDVDN